MNVATEGRTIGLVLRTRPLTESSLIVSWLTEHFGRLSTLAKGARRAKSPFSGKLDLLYLAEFTFQRSRRTELHLLREVVVQDFHPALRRNLCSFQQAAYFVQLIEQTTETETPIPGVFNLLNSALDALSRQTPHPLLVFAFEMKLLHELGLHPDLHSRVLSDGATQILSSAASSDWASLGRLQVNRAPVHEVRQFLHDFLLYHLGRIPVARTVALAC